MLNAGELREKIELFRSVRTPNASGGGSFEDVSYLNTFAKVVEISSNPELIAQGEQVQQMVLVTIRFRTDVNMQNGDVMKWRGFNYVLNNFKVDPMRTKIEMVLAFAANTTKRTSE